MYEMDPVTQLQPRVRPMFQEKHLICIFLGFVNTWKPEAVCSKEVITDGWSEEHRDSRFISPPAAWGSTSSLSTHQSLQKSFITSSNASSSLKPESLSTLIHSCLEFIVVWLSLVLLLCSSLSSTSPPAVSWETPMEYEQLLDAVDVSGHRGNRSLSEILCGNPGRLWNRN